MMGSTIRFSAAASYDNNPGTKTEYSGVIIGDEVMGETPAKERINWLATDKIRIYSDVATDRNTGATWTKMTATVRPSWLTSNKYTGPAASLPRMSNSPSRRLRWHMLTRMRAPTKMLHMTCPPMIFIMPLI